MAPNEQNDEDPFDSAAELGVEDIEVEEPDSAEVGKTPASAAIATETPDRQAELLDLAHRLDVRPDDPAWLLVKAALEAQQAAATTTQAMNKLGDAPGAIERAALEGAGRAAAEIQQNAKAGAEAIASTLAGQIEAASAEPFKRVLKPYLRDLSQEAGDVRSAIREGVDYKINQITGDFLKKTQKEIDRRSVATKAAGRMSAILILILGAAIGVAGTKLDHRWSPTPIHSAASGGYSIRVPSGYGGKFRHCGGHECVYLYPPRSHGQRTGK